MSASISASKTRAALTTFIATVLWAGAIAHAEPTEPESFQRSFALKAGGTLRVDNYKGTIHITGSDAKEVVVNVVKRFEGSQSDRAWWMEETKVGFRNDGDRVEIVVKYPNINWNWGWPWHGDYQAAVELEIKVPRRTNLDINGYKPEIRISAVEGDLRIDSYKSPITLDSTRGAVNIDTYKDMVSLRNIAVRGKLHVKSYRADVTIDAVELGEMADLENYRGTIILRVPRDLGMDLDFEGSRRASFHSDFPMAAETMTGNGTVRRTINQGGARVKVRTERGSLSLEKRSGQL